MIRGAAPHALTSGPARRRLQTLYVLAAAGLAALVPLMLFAGFWIRSELTKSQRDVESFLNAQAATFSQRVDGEVREQLAALRALAALPDLDSDAGGFAAAARQITGAMRHWTHLALYDPRSATPIFSTGSGEAPVVSPAVLDEARSGLKPLVDSQVGSASRGILLYMPVIRDGRAERVLVATFSAEDIQEVALAQARDPALVFFVVDRSNLTLARSLMPEMIGRPIDPALREAFATSPSGTDRSLRAGGDDIWSSYVRSDLTGWVSGVATTGRQIDRLSARSLWATVAAGALSLILAGILAVFIIHSVMERRVSEERLSASRALSDLDARLLAATQDSLAEQRKASSEREVLLREIYHRVKNNLQIVQSLLRLGSRDLKPEQREPFESAVRRIGAMSRVHTLLYNSPDLASIDFRDYLEELLKELSEGFAAEERSIQSALEALPMRMPLDTAVPLAFIAVEILTNSFKHAFPEGRSGRITVEVRREGDTAILSIRDDGVGFPAETVGKSRLGLTIVRKLVQQIGGTFDEPEPGASTFVVRFPAQDGLLAGGPLQDGPPHPPSLREVADAASS